MSKLNKFQEELDVLAFNQQELDSLQKELNHLGGRMTKSQIELKGFNHQRKIEWEKVNTTRPIEFQINKEPSWANIVNMARKTQVRKANYSDFLTDEEIVSSITALYDLRVELNEEYSSKMVDELKENFLQSLIGPFGLSLHMLRAFDGGAIPTVHNANKGMIPHDKNGEKLEDYQSKYNRDDYAPQHKMNQQRKERFKDSEPIIDGYTGKELNRNGQSHIEHVVSASELHGDDWARLFLNADKRKELINNEDNIIWTNGSLNQSKSDTDLITWMNTPSKKDPTKTNAQYYEMDTEKAKEAYQRAQKNKKQAVYKAVGKEVFVQCGKTSIKMGFRKALGYILYEFAKDVFKETKEVFQKKKHQAINLKDELTSRFKMIVKNISGKWKEIIKQFFDGAIAGFFSELIIFIINQFVTTLKRMVRIIKEGFMSLIGMIRFVVSPPEDLLREEIYQQCLKMGTTLLITSGGILLEEVIEKFLLSNIATAPLATFLAPIITGLLTGLLLSVIMYGIDKLDFFGAKEKKIDQRISQKIMDDLWAIEAEFDAVFV
ncbi:hypothetical protein [Neobacillus drentensis]|uniref:hypothetical protein n=1 Tax=Neobacillus drentensis TaxID=220684 RepID=UPI002858320C|nr:hypothetical protein [Neobacillus drentensis]MDR7238779.1 hypothetical protein [Neobacillus drentensis]